jgi:peptidoglycan/LPS O-acetylase OafA/YrhL
MSLQTYRPDIDGLRSIAILSVLAFHLSPGLAPGGFLGVDVFFVISGFLITQSLMHQGYRGFYVRRINRLFPALVVVLLVSVAAGWALLLPEEFRTLGKHVRASAAFLQNVNLNLETGYFDRASDAKPLLHLWSLAVEEQFYVLWPLMLMPAWRKGHGLLLALVLLLASLGYASWMCSKGHADVAFFRFACRAWEPLVGCALALWHARQVQLDERPWGDHFQLLGLLAIGASVFMFNDQSSQMPGLATLPAVLGAAAIIHGGARLGRLRAFLGHPWPRYIGKISYPLYLVHWPVIAYKNIVLGHTESPGILLSCLLLSLAFAAMLYHRVEQPLHRFLKQARWGTYVLGATMLVFVLLGTAMHLRWLPSSKPSADITAQLDSMALGRMRNQTSATCAGLTPEDGLTPYCASDKRFPNRMVVWGDSKADAIYWGLVQQSTPRSGGWSLLGLYSCTPMAGVQRTLPHRDISAERCNASNQNALAALASDSGLQTVLIASASRQSQPSADAATQGLIQAIRTLQAAGKRVLLLADNPTIVDPNFCVSRASKIPWNTLAELVNRSVEGACTTPLDVYVRHTAPYRAILRSVSEATEAPIVATDDLNCSASDNLCAVRQGRILRYSYGDHYSDAGSANVAARIQKAIDAQQTTTSRPNRQAEEFPTP